MSQEFYWLTLTTLVTGLFWMPYVLNRFAEIGIFTAILSADGAPQAEATWAQRMTKAHKNAVENLIIFAPLVLIIHMTGLNNALTASATMIYFFARLAHFIVYTLGIPAARTLAFLTGFACQMVLALTCLGMI